MLPFTVHPVGDSALLAVFTQRIAPEIGAAVAALNTRVSVRQHLRRGRDRARLCLADGHLRPIGDRL